MILSPKILPTRKMINAHCADPDITSRHARERVRSDIETAVTCDVLHTRVAFIEGATRRASEALEFLFSSGCRVRRGGRGKQIWLWHRLEQLNQNSISNVISCRLVTTARLQWRRWASHARQMSGGKVFKRCSLIHL